MVESLRSIVQSQPAGLLWSGALVAAALLYVMGYAIDRRAVARRSRELFVALNDSAFGVPEASVGPGPDGFQAQTVPPPEPFVDFHTIHEVDRVLNPLAWLFPATVSRRESIYFFANLPAPPTQELAWARRRTPPAALSASADRILWTLHHLDFTDSEYATRGDNPNGVRHAFVELQTRFGPVLEQLTVYREDDFHVRVMARSSSLAGADMLKLVSLVRAMGRAAQF